MSQDIAASLASAGFELLVAYAKRRGVPPATVASWCGRKLCASAKVAGLRYVKADEADKVVHIRKPRKGAAVAPGTTPIDTLTPGPGPDGQPVGLTSSYWDGYAWHPSVTIKTKDLMLLLDICVKAAIREIL